MGPKDGLPGLSIDAGARAPSVASDASVLDAGSGDAGVAPSDAQTEPSGDAAARPSYCTHPADAGAAGDAGACSGGTCPASELFPDTLRATGACLAPSDLALVCSGELAGVVAACAQDDALALGLGSTVEDCARDTPSLAAASDGCIDCHVQETLCAVQSCLTPCLAGLTPLCTACRTAQCAAAFSACSGLPLF